MTERDKYIERVKGNNKERDYNLIEHYALYPEKTYVTLATELDLELSEARITQILKENIRLKNDLILLFNPLAHKEGRIAEYIKEYRKKELTQYLTKKDKTDLLEAIRKEQDDKPLIDNSVRQYVHFYRPEPHDREKVEAKSRPANRSL